ncbi:hypothetical protein FKP32DRAFT_1333677 [Trametes sanguinea]|nr:hypothetical protein FKP32DRAFT_1333677 [Trametes sanguinea]
MRLLSSCCALSLSLSLSLPVLQYTIRIFATHARTNAPSDRPRQERTTATDSRASDDDGDATRTWGGREDRDRETEPKPNQTKGGEDHIPRWRGVRWRVRARGRGMYVQRDVALLSGAGTARGDDRDGMLVCERCMRECVCMCVWCGVGGEVYAWVWRAMR